MTETETIHAAHLTVGPLRQALERAAIFAATDETRPILNGVCMEFEPERDRVICIGTEGWAMIMAEALGKPGNVHKADQIVIPLDSVRAILKMLPRKKSDADLAVALDIEIRPDADRLTVTMGDQSMAVDLKTGTFPNYRQLIPTEQGETNGTATINPALLAKLAKAAGRDAADKTTIWTAHHSSPIVASGLGFVAVIMPVFVELGTFAEEVTAFTRTAPPVADPVAVSA